MKRRAIQASVAAVDAKAALQREGMTAPTDDTTESGFAIEARRLVNGGLVFAAYDIAAAGLRAFPASWRLRHLAALALAEAGAREEALASLDGQAGEAGDGFTELMGLRARIHKDLWREGRGITHLLTARDLYAHAFDVTRSSFAGINAAAMTFAAGDAAAAARLARSVYDAVAAEVETENHESSYWREATQGEAALLAGLAGDRATHHYAKARLLAASQYRLLLSSRRQLLLLADAGLAVPTAIFDILKPPNVVAFLSGAEPLAAIPADVESTLAQALPDISFSSAARGADLDFIEKMLARGVEVNIVLPFARDDFLAKCVGSDKGARARFDRVIAAAAQVTFATAEPFLDDHTLFAFADEMIAGLAIAHSRQLGGKAVLLRGDAPKSNAVLPGQSAFRSQKREIRALLFADIVGFSKLGEEHFAAFSRFLSDVKQKLGASRSEPEYINTWGDAVFAVHGEVEALAEYAFELRRAITSASSQMSQMIEPLRVRIALHAGPVFRLDDALTARENYYGSHVNRAARLEPLARPNQIFASEQFVALLEYRRATQSTAGSRRWRSTYIGLLDLPKGSGRQRVYLLDEEA